MPGHSHDNTHSSANTGNVLGDRSSVRQSKLYRQYESGNDVKGILGTENLQWRTDKKEGVYDGHDLYVYIYMCVCVCVCLNSMCVCVSFSRTH